MMVMVMMMEVMVTELEMMVMVMVMMVTELERAMRTASLWQFRSNLPKNKNVPMVEVKRN